MGMVLTIFLLVIVALLAYFIYIFNTLVVLSNRFKNAFSQIEVQLKRRYDLIPNLISVAKKAMRHEQETLEAVVKARNESLALLETAAKHPDSQKAIRQLAQSEDVLMGALSKLNVVMEAYPDLKTSENMMQLSEELSSTENKVAFARQAFNDQVMAYNIFRQSFPNIWVAASFGHPFDAELLEFADSEQIQQPPKVDFS